MGKIKTLFILCVLALLAQLVFGLEAKYFEDNFESGTIDRWDSATTGGTNTVGVTEDAVRMGNYGFEADDNDASSANCYVSKSLSIPSTGYLRYYIMVSSGFFNPMGNTENREGPEVLSAGGGAIKNLISISFGGVRRFLIDIAGSTEGFEGVEEDRWYCIEYQLSTPTVSNTFRWWVDGVEQGGITRDFSSFQSWDQLDMGLQFGTAAWIQKIFIEEVFVDDKRIGASKRFQKSINIQ